jgi:hypothetical protein
MCYNQMMLCQSLSVTNCAVMSVSYQEGGEDNLRICGGASTPCNLLPVLGMWRGSRSSRACTASPATRGKADTHSLGEQQQLQQQHGATCRLHKASIIHSYRDSVSSKRQSLRSHTSWKSIQKL